MTYQKTLEYIHSVCWKGSRPGLGRITELCRRLDNPQKKLRFVHVAGTNGKGSVCAMTASVLRRAGYRVGLFTSPYLVDFCERIVIDGRRISHAALCRAAAAVRPHADAMEDLPTEFELITAIALVCFAEAGCDIVVFECGMGGRLDSTNVIDSPEASVITNIALDHTEYLGGTVEKIALEKAGIVKAAPCVLGTAPESAAQVISSVCREKGVDLIRADRDIVIDGVRPGKKGISFTFGGAKMSVPLCGLYQVTNVKTVLAAIDVLRRGGWDIPDSAVTAGLRSVRWPGRFETLRRNPRIIFDGAHNGDGAAFTAATFSRLYPGERAILVSGVMADKDRAAIAAELAKVCRCAFTCAPGNPRALAAERWATELSDAGIDAEGCSCVAEALLRAIRESESSGDTILCAGSLYMYGEIVTALKELN